MFENTHVIILDIHNEYSAAFRDYGNLINITELEMPYWFMNFEEMREMFQTNFQLKKDVRGKGNIIIPFNSNEELERIIDILEH